MGGRAAEQFGKISTMGGRAAERSGKTFTMGGRLVLKMQAQPNSSFTAKAPTADAK